MSLDDKNSRWNAPLSDEDEFNGAVLNQTDAFDVDDVNEVAYDNRVELLKLLKANDALAIGNLFIKTMDETIFRRAQIQHYGEVVLKNKTAKG